jgi:hypothetical protein
MIVHAEFSRFSMEMEMEMEIQVAFGPSGPILASDSRPQHLDSLLVAFVALGAKGEHDQVHRMALFTWALRKLQERGDGVDLPSLDNLQSALNAGCDYGYLKEANGSGFYSLTSSGLYATPDTNSYGNAVEDEERLFVANRAFQARLTARFRQTTVVAVYRGNMRRSRIASVSVDGIPHRTVKSAMEALGVQPTGKASSDLYRVLFARESHFTAVEWLT